MNFIINIMLFGSFLWLSILSFSIISNSNVAMDIFKSLSLFFIGLGCLIIMIINIKDQKMSREENKKNKILKQEAVISEAIYILVKNPPKTFGFEINKDEDDGNDW